MTVRCRSGIYQIQRDDPRISKSGCSSRRRTEKYRELIFQEQPYLANVYPGSTREIGIIFCVRDMQIEYFHLGVHPIFRMQYTIGNGEKKPKGYTITGDCIGCGTCAGYALRDALNRENLSALCRSTVFTAGVV